jgi:hypothetical protein
MGTGMLLGARVEVRELPGVGVDHGWKIHGGNAWGAASPNPPRVEQEGPAHWVTVWWDSRENMSMNYTGRIYIEGPAGTPHK